MSLLVDVTKITSATAATVGTNTAGTNQPIDFLSGFTLYGVQPGEVPADSPTVNALVQTNDATAPVLRLDAAASVWAGANQYHRLRLRVQLTKQFRDAAGVVPIQALSTSGGSGSPTAGEWVEESSALLPRGKFIQFTDSTVIQLGECQGTFTGSGTLTGKSSAMTRTAGAIRPAAQTLIDVNGNTAASNRGRLRLMLCNPNLSAPDLVRYAGSMVSACLYIEDPAGGYAGAELSRNHTESGNVFLNAAGTGLASGVFTPSFPVDEWVWLDIVIDRNTKRMTYAVNGWLMGFHSFADMSANTTTSLTITLPIFYGFRWKLIGMQSRAEVDYTTDTEVSVPVVHPKAACSWKIAPTFANLTNSGQRKISIGTPTNATFLSRPESLASGVRPFSESGEWTTTSNSGVVCPFGISGAVPYVANDDGWATFMFALRPEGTTWSGTFGFQAASFQLDYSGGHYRVRDSAGNLIFTFDANEQAILFVCFNHTAQLVKATLYNNSKDINAETICGGRDVTLHASDVIPTADNFQFAGSFTATTSGVKMKVEMFSCWRELTLLSVDSYTCAALQGSQDQSSPAASWGQVGTYSTAARATINSPSLLNTAWNFADCNPHQLCCFPYGSAMPKISFVPVGRSGRTFTSFVALQLAGLDYLVGYHHVVLGGLANNMNGATTSPLADSISDQLAADFDTAARHALKRSGRFTWIETEYPFDLSAGTGSPSPTANPFGQAYSKKCWYDAKTKIRAKLERLQATHRLGHRVSILKVGSCPFSDGVHLGINGTVPAMIDATTQLKNANERADAVDRLGNAADAGAFATGLAVGMQIGK